MEAYKIWASLELKGNARAEMEKFAKMTKLASEQVTTLNKKIWGLNLRLEQFISNLNKSSAAAELFTSRLAGLGTVADKATVDINKYSRATKSSTADSAAFKAASASMSHGLMTIGDSAKYAQYSVEGMQESTIHAKSMQLIPKVTRGDYYTDTGRKSYSYTEHAEDAEFEEYRRQATGGGGRGKIPPEEPPHTGTAGHFGAHHLHTFGLGELARPVGTAMAAGYAFGPVGATAATGAFIFSQGFQQQKLYDQSLLGLKAQNVTTKQLDQAKKLAEKSIPGISTADMMESILAGYMSTRSFPEALKIAPLLAKYNFAAQAATGMMTPRQEQDAIKFAEQRGGSDRVSIEKWLNTENMMSILSGFTVLPSEMRQFSSISAGALSGLTPEAFLSIEPVLQELKGNRTATGLTTLARAYTDPVAAHYSKARMAELNKLGMIDPNTGHVARKFTDELSSDPFAFMKDMLNQFKKIGITSTPDILNEFHKILPRTSEAVFVSMYKAMAKIEEVRKMVEQDKVFNISQEFKASKDTTGGSLLQLEKAWQRLTQDIYKISAPTVVKGMNLLSSTLERLSSVFSHFSDQKGLTNMSAASNLNSSWQQDWKNSHLLSSIENYIRGNDQDSPRNITQKTSLSPQQSSEGNVYLDKEKVGKILFPVFTNMATRGAVINSPTSFNISLTPTPTAYNGN